MSQQINGIDRAALERIWGGIGCKIPAVHWHPWRDVVPSDYRAAAMAPDDPIAIGDIRSLTAALRDALPFQQLLRASRAALRVIEALAPMMSRSLAGRRLVEASGVTVLMVVPNHGDPMLVPWSSGESAREAVLRIKYWRRRAPLRLSASDATLLRAYLPMPQCAISIVGQAGPMLPITNILASGGGCPIAIAVGAEAVGFALDHRIYDAIQAGAFYTAFEAALVEGIE